MSKELLDRATTAVLNCAAWSSFWSEDDARVLAQAALKAHAEYHEERGLTEEMKLAGARSLRDSFGWTNQSERATACYKAMISAAHQQKE